MLWIWSTNNIWDLQIRLEKNASNSYGEKSIPASQKKKFKAQDLGFGAKKICGLLTFGYGLKNLFEHHKTNENSICDLQIQHEPG